MHIQVVLLVSLLLIRQCVSTWSILAIDRRTQQIGVAMASCLDRELFEYNADTFLEHSFSAVPCKGGIMAQAIIQNEMGPAATVGVNLLEQSTEPGDILAQIANPTTDGEMYEYCNLELDNCTTVYETPNYKLRQYGIVDYQGRTAGYTDPALSDLYAFYNSPKSEETSRQAATKSYVYSAQGNIVAVGVVDATAQAFEDSDKKTGGEDSACNDLTDRLLESLKAGWAAGGDVRCKQSTGALLGYLKVMGPNGTMQVDLRVSFGGLENVAAVEALEEEYKIWREDHPCGTFSSPSSFCDDYKTGTVEDDRSPPMSGSVSAALTFTAVLRSFFVAIILATT